ncbi:MAG: adenosylcobinamide amidohydrolase [Nitrospira sp.]|nr:adenosylcobinamide amidohydrolase [Nitrospira sp.]
MASAGSRGNHIACRPRHVDRRLRQSYARPVLRAARRRSANHSLHSQSPGGVQSLVERRREILEHPSRYLRRLAGLLGVEADCVGLMTAVPMTQLVSRREERGGLWVECYATVSVTNAVQAGERPSHGPAFVHGKPGTINLIVVTNACLAVSALVGAVQVATEAKTGILRDRAVPSWTGSPGATGTGTDTVVAACALRGCGPCAVCGVHIPTSVP